MARQAHTALSALGTKTNAYSANAADLTMLAADTDDYEDVVHTGNLLVIAHNGGVGASTITITSVVDSQGRTGNISYSLGAGEYAVFGPFKVEGWEQTDGKLYFAADSADVNLGVVAI